MRRVVYLMNPSNVDTAFIAGKARKWRGDLVAVDVPRVLRRRPCSSGAGGFRTRTRRAICRSVGLKQLDKIS
jgi:hypothetical protein